MHFLFNLLRIKGPTHVWRITCSSSGDAAQTALGILCACYVTCTWCSQLTYHLHNIPSAACAANPEDELVMLETCIARLILNKLNKKRIMVYSLIYHFRSLCTLHTDIFALCTAINKIFLNYTNQIHNV
jgi:hypothetical protein